MTKPAETDLYPPLKTYFEAMDYEVKAEIGAADLVALKPGSEPLVVELKTGFSLTLLQQAVARQAVTQDVYVAVPRWSGRAGWKAFKGNLGLCRRLGLGVISVCLRDGFVQVHADPGPHQPRKSKKRRAALLKEFSAREGDSNQGGTRGQVMTAYKQDALRCAGFLQQAEPAKGAMVAKEAGVSRATQIMADNHSGWFRRVERGIYALSEAGEVAVKETGAGG